MIAKTNKDVLRMMVDFLEGNMEDDPISILVYSYFAGGWIYRSHRNTYKLLDRALTARYDVASSKWTKGHKI